MIISRGSENKQVTLYPPASSIIELEQMSWIEETNSQEETVHSFCSIDQAINFREENDENVLNHLISNPDIKEKLESLQKISTNNILEQGFQENCTIESLQSSFETIFPVSTVSDSHCKTVEIFPGKCLNINANLEKYQEERLIQLLKNYSKSFS
jgi:hypothetical protein